MYDRLRWGCLVGLGALILVAAMGTPARAGTISVFGSVPTGGSVGHIGGANPFFGLGIALDGVLSAGTPLNAGALAACIDCELSFQTGNLIIGDTTAWSFESGGYFSISGGLDLTGNGLLGDPGDLAVGTTLLSGSFGSNPITPFVGISTGTNPFVAVALSYADAVVNGDVAAFFGEATLATGYMTFQFNGVGDAPGAFGSTEIQDVVIVATPVPEASSLLLLATGLLLLQARRPGRLG